MHKGPKYKFTNEAISVNGQKLNRIQALYDFSDVKKDELGGFIKDEANLSHYDDCWVYGDAKVYENAQVYENAKVKGNAKLHGNALLHGYALVEDDCNISGKANICDNARISGNTCLSQSIIINNQVEIEDNTIKDKNREISLDELINQYDKQKTEQGFDR